MNKSSLGLERKADKNDQEWLVPFLDIMTFLMAFAIILYTTMAADLQQMEKMKESIQQAMGQEVASDVEPAIAVIDYRDVYEAINGYIQRNKLEGRASVRMTQRGVELTANGELLFASGSTELKPLARDFLAGISIMIRDVPYTIMVEGHTDDVPMKSSIYPSNWELSTARASGVVRLFLDKGIAAQRLKAVGYAETRPREGIESLSLREQRAANRRVVLVFQKEQ